MASPAMGRDSDLYHEGSQRGQKCGLRGPLEELDKAGSRWGWGVSGCLREPGLPVKGKD